jgi:hypothetical protein
MKASPGDSGCGKNAVKATPTKSAMSAIGILLKFRFTLFDAALNIPPRALPNRVAVDDSDGVPWSVSIPPALSLLKTRTFILSNFVDFSLPFLAPNGTNPCRWVLPFLLLVLRSRFLTNEVVVIDADVDAVFLLSEAMIFIASALASFLPTSSPPTKDDDTIDFVVVLLPR